MYKYLFSSTILIELGERREAGYRTEKYIQLMSD
jgi:hypothetical protein